MNQTNDFIKELSSKLGRSTPTETPQPVVYKVPQYKVPETENIAEVFINNWQALSGKGEIVKSPEDIINYLQGWFGNLGIGKNPQPIIAWDRLPLIAEEAFSALSWTLTRYSETPSESQERYSIAAESALGITGGDWGIALSGTIVINSHAQRGRAVSLLPPRHLTFIEKSKLRNNLSEVLDEISKLGKLPSAIELITGPSRTSDIEMDLSIGVHGPIEVYVIVIDD
jgi:L-lactate dehydrogenase complex protein LldG